MLTKQKDNNKTFTKTNIFPLKHIFALIYLESKCSKWWISLTTFDSTLLH